MKVVTGTILALSFFTVSIPSASAGTKYVLPVVVSNGTQGYADGSIGSTRSTPDSLQYLGCTIGGYYAICSARNAAGVAVACFTDDVEFLKAVSSISGDSHLRFNFSNGACTSIVVKNSSEWAPK